MAWNAMDKWLRDWVMTGVAPAFLHGQVAPYRVMMAKAGEVVEAESLTCAMYDTGANLSITNPQLAVMLALEPVAWPRPVPITFGNATEAVSTHYILLGPLLGRVALVEGAPSTIITRQSLQEGGLSVLFRADGVTVIFDQQGEVVFEAHLGKNGDFLMLPLEEFLPLQLTEALAAYQQTGRQAEVNGRRRSPPVTAAEVTAVMELHERMYHPSSAVMARALRAGAWPGVNLDPTLVERVFRHQDCLFCALGKMKRLPRCEGSTLGAQFGDEVSMDYLPVTTVAKGGFKGAYVAVERTVGYAWVYLTARHNGIQMLKAVEAVRLCLSSHGWRLKMLRTDAGTVEAGQELAAQLAERQVTINAAAPEAQYQNFVERFIQTAARGLATTLLAQRFLDNTFWGMALLAWVRAWNCRPNQASGTYSPEFTLTGRHPCIDTQFRLAFGTAVASRKMGTSSTRRSKAVSSEVKLQQSRDAGVDDKFKFTASGELGFVVGNTASMNGASLIFVPKKGRNVAFPRVDVQVIHTGESPATEVEIKRRLEELTITSAGISLPVTSVVTVPGSSDPVSADMSKSTFDDEVAVAFEQLYKSQESAVEHSPVDMESAGASKGGVESVGTTQESSGTPDVTIESVASPMPVATSSVEVSSPAVGGASEDDEEDQEGGPEPQVITGPAAGTRSKRLFSVAVTSGEESGEGPESFRRRVGHDEAGSDSGAEEREYEYVVSCCGPWDVKSAVVRAAKHAFSDDMPTITKALKSDRAAEWIEAIEKEVQNLVSHNTGTEVRREEVPRGAQILPIKVVLKLKRDTEGLPTKFKARLCVLGNLKFKSLSVVFSPTANEKSLKFLLALATALGLWMSSIDVYGAFLYPDMTEEVFVRIPESITGGQEILWRLNKTMYGLDLSPRAYYDHVSAHLLKGGYNRCSNDPCLFWKRLGSADGGATQFLLTVVHVDDFAVAATDFALIEEFIAYMETVYTVSVTREVEHFVGIHVSDLGNGRRGLSQPGLLKKLFERYPAVKQLTSYPQVPMSTLFSDEVQDDSPRCNSHDYMELLGSLMYLEKTRADIAFAVNRLAMRTQKATEKDYRSLLRVLAYLYVTRGKEVVLKPCRELSASRICCLVAPLEAWCDASYAIHPDGRSHSGYGFRLAGTGSGLFYARSTKQTNVALSSTEAELNAAVECVKDVVWFRELRAEIGMSELEPTAIYVDNASLITLATSYSGNHKRVKHFLVRLNYLIDLVEKKVIKFMKVDTTLNCSDPLTKPLGPIDFLPKVGDMLGCE